MARLHILNSKLPIIRHIVICCVWFKGNVHQVISVTELHTKSISVCFNHQLTFSILQISTHQVKWLMKYCIWKYKWLRRSSFVFYIHVLLQYNSAFLFERCSAMSLIGECYIFCWALRKYSRKKQIFDRIMYRYPITVFLQYPFQSLTQILKWNWNMDFLLKGQ